MPRKLIEWRIKNEPWTLGQRTLLIGAINVAPDSADDGGRYQDPERAATRALEMVEQGADMIEISAESWHAGSHRVPEAEELRRLVPVLKKLKGRIVQPIIVETSKSAVAEKAIEHGATVLRDPTGLVLDLNVAKVAAQHDTGLILAHMRGRPEEWAKLGNVKDPVGGLLNDLDASIGRAKSAGVQRYRLAIDPGIGMGKRKEHNTEILSQIPRIVEPGLPVIIGPSGKPFSTAVASDPDLASSLAAAAIAVRFGIHLLRVQDVAAHRVAAMVADASYPEEIPAPVERPPLAKRDTFGEERPRRPVRPGLRPR